MKKLLSITPHLSTGGGPQVLVKRIELIKDEFDVYVVEYANISRDFVVQKNRIKKLIKESNFFTLGDNKMELIDIIDIIKPDFIHMEEIPEMFMDYNVALKIYKGDRDYKIFETTHSSDYKVENKIFFPDKFIFVSQYNCFKFNKFGIPTEVVEYPIDKKERTIIDKKLAMKKLGLDPQYKHILNVGLFTPRKNQAYAFDIARRLLKDKILVHFVGNQAGNFQHYWQPLMDNKPENCVIWGERDDVDVFYKACDLFLFTSRGFRYDKELNPLVIKEALQEDIPLFLFPLDVYCGKYDDNDNCIYLTGNIENDVELIKNFLNDNDKHIIDSKYNIKVVHLLDGENIEKESIKSISKLENYGISYKQFNKIKYNGVPPFETCLRPYDIGRLGVRGIQSGDYGNYLSYRKAIETEFGKDIDFLLLVENNCVIKDIDMFADILYKSVDVMNKEGIKYMSMGDKYNSNDVSLMSDNIGRIDNVDWMYLTDYVPQLQFIIFNKNIKNLIFDKYRSGKWDNTIFWLKHFFEGEKISIVYESLINKLEEYHDELHNDNIIKSDDIKMVYYDDDYKLSFKFKDRILDERKFKLIFKDNEENILYSTQYNISNRYESWSKINALKDITEVEVDFYDYDDYLFSKRMKINHVELNEDKDENEDLFIVSTYPDTLLKKDITIKCIESVRKSGKKVMVSSHLPLDKDIQNLSDYYVYDSFNPMIEHSFYKNYWYETNDYRSDVLLCELNGLNQSLSVFNNINNSIRMAKLLGYKRVISVSYDFIFSDDDIDTINRICDNLDNEGKSGYFMKFVENGMDLLKTVFFIIDVDLFIDIFDNLRFPDMYNKECVDIGSENFLESYFSKKIDIFKDKLLIDKVTEKVIFNGKLNIFSGVEYLTILPIVGSDDSFVIWFNSSNIFDNRKIVIEKFNNGKLDDTYEYLIDSKKIIYKMMNIDDGDNIELFVKFYDNDTDSMIKSDYFGIINKDNMENILSNRGRFLFKSKPTSGDITTIINFKTKDYLKLKESIDSVKPISNKVIVCLSDRLHDGSIEDEDIINKSYEDNHKDNVDFIQYEYDNDLNDIDSDYWDNVGRVLSVKYSNNDDWLLFINSDESIITSNFDLFFSNVKNDIVDKYLLSDNDSPLLIKYRDIDLIGNRYDIFNNSDGNKKLDVENKFKIKLYKKL